MLLLSCQVVSNPDVCMHLSINVFHCAFVQAELSPGLQALPRGRRSSWTDGWCDRFSAESQPWIGNRERGTDWGFRVGGSVWQSEKTFRQRHQKRMNSCLTTGAADQQTVTDWQTLSRRWRCGHCATPSQLARWNRICFSDPVGTLLKNSLPSLYLNPAQG